MRRTLLAALALGLSHAGCTPPEEPIPDAQVKVPPAKKSQNNMSAIEKQLQAAKAKADAKAGRK